MAGSDPGPDPRIRNSLAPISSLAASVEQHFTAGTDDGPAALTQGRRKKIREALRVIQRRSQGLLQFVDTYRDLAHLPRPELQLCRVQEQFDEWSGWSLHRLPIRR